jgi:hypothetical protein
MLPFRSRLGEPWLYLQLGWGGILGAYFHLWLGSILAVASTLAGFLLILPLLWYRWKDLSTSIGPLRLVFYFGSILLVFSAIALKLVD